MSHGYPMKNLNNVTFFMSLLLHLKFDHELYVAKLIAKCEVSFSRVKNAIYMNFSDFTAVPRYPYLHKSNTYLGTPPTTTIPCCHHAGPYRPSAPFYLLLPRDSLPRRQPAAFAAPLCCRWQSCVEVESSATTELIN